MDKLRFFSRVALICNVCFLLTVSLHFLPFRSDGFAPSTIIILGYLLAFIVNAAVCISVLVLLAFRRPVIRGIPAWLFIVNIIFFIFQLILFNR